MLSTLRFTVLISLTTAAATGPAAGPAAGHAAGAGADGDGIPPLLGCDEADAAAQSADPERPRDSRPADTPAISADPV